MLSLGKACMSHFLFQILRAHFDFDNHIGGNAEKEQKGGKFLIPLCTFCPVELKRKRGIPVWQNAKIYI